MKKETYEILHIESPDSYYFVSEGKREIIKVVTFEEFAPNSYNLALGDYDVDTKEVDYRVKSKNGDIDKIYATVAKIVEDFTNNHPDCSIYIAGDEEYKTKS